MELAEQIKTSAQLAVDGGFGLPLPVFIALAVFFVVGTYAHLKS